MIYIHSESVYMANDTTLDLDHQKISEQCIVCIASLPGLRFIRLHEGKAQAVLYLCTTE